MKISDTVLDKIKGEALLDHFNESAPDTIIPASVSIGFTPRQGLEQAIELTNNINRVIGEGVPYNVFPDAGRLTVQGISAQALATLMEQDFVTEAALATRTGHRMRGDDTGPRL